MAKTYEIRDMMKCGKAMKGMVAATDINAGDIILKETPQLMIEFPENFKDLPFGHMERLLLEEYRSMNEADRARYDTLSYIESTDLAHYTQLLCEGEPYDEEKGKVVCRFATNSYQDQRGKWQYVAIDGARINHACAANAIFRYNERENTFVVLALQKIAQGAEILMSYVSRMETNAARASYFKDFHNFECDCKICTSEPLFDDNTALELQEADRKLVEIRGRAEDTSQASVEVDIEEKMAIIEFILEKTRGKEALIPERFMRLEDYICLLEWTGRATLHEAKEFYEEAYQLGTILRGPDDPRVVLYARAFDRFQ